jgi:hypothetical protein
MTSEASARMRARDITRQLIGDLEYRRALTSQIAERTVDPDILEQLIAFARNRQATLEAAMARKVLTDAGVSWEAC